MENTTIKFYDYDGGFSNNHDDVIIKIDVEGDLSDKSLTKLLDAVAYANDRDALDIGKFKVTRWEDMEGWNERLTCSHSDQRCAC